MQILEVVLSFNPPACYIDATWIGDFGEQQTHWQSAVMLKISGYVYLLVNLVGILKLCCVKIKRRTTLIIPLLLELVQTPRFDSQHILLRGMHHLVVLQHNL